MELKATNDNGKSNRISGFQLTADNVLSTEVGDKVTIKDNVDFTKAITTDARNNQKAIGITSNGVIDFAGYTQGVYTLDVVVDDDKAYEAIIAIGYQTNQIVDKEITRVNSDYRIEFVFPPIEEPIDEDCDDSEGSGGLNYPFDKKSECVIEEYQQCEIDELNGLPETDKCNDLDEGFNDDCFGFTNSEECNAYWTDHDKFCQLNPEHGKCPIIYVPEGQCDGYIDTNTQECIPVTATSEPLTPTPEPTPEPTPSALALPPTPEPTPTPTSETLLDFPTEEIEEIPNVPLEDTEEEEVEEDEPEEPEPEEESSGSDNEDSEEPGSENEKEDEGSEQESQGDN